MKNISSYLKYKKKQHRSRAAKAIEIDDQTIMHLFSRAVRDEYGRQGEKNIVPKFYKNGIIFVQIQNSMWAQELWMNRSLFIRALNEKIGNKVIKNIKIAT